MRLRPLVAPLFLLLCGAALLWMNRHGTWHSNKAEGAGWLFSVIAVIWLPFGVYRVAKPLQLAVGVAVVIPVGESAAESGTIVKMEGDLCTVRTTRGDYEINRYAIISLVHVPPKAA